MTDELKPVEIRLRGKYRQPGAAKNTGKGKAGGNSGTPTHGSGLLPVGIRRRPRRKYGA